MSDKLHWKHSRTIAELFIDDPKEVNIRQFFVWSGLKTDRQVVDKSSYIDNIFFKEVDFQKNFDFQKIKNKITANNAK
jgi:hypothetical protein